MKKVTEYDIEKIYSDMEKYLIKNIIRNLTSDLHSFHLKEEEELGFKWEAWQTAKLRDLQKFRRQNKDIVNSRTKGINKKIAALLNKEAMQGKKTAYKEYKEALTHGYNSSVQVKDSFFKMSSRKVRKLIGSVTNDFQKVNQATFRRSNDIYRQIIVEASMYKNTGVMTSKQAINKAIEDFKSRGINSIVYSNGSKHKISDYASMAIRTASTRAQLMGEGELRKKMGVSTIQMSKHSTSCKLCQPWEGKVLIDDVYSGGSKKDGNYPLLSDAMKQGLYHPNCRHGHGTYFPELSKKSNEEIIENPNIKKETKKMKYQDMAQDDTDFIIKSESNVGNVSNDRMEVIKAISTLNKQTQELIKNTTFTVGSKTNSKYMRKSDIIVVRKGAKFYEIIHEMGHVVETKLNLYENEEFVKLLKNKFDGWMFDDLEVYIDDLTGIEVYLAKNQDGFVSEYQSRAYINDKHGNLKIDTSKEIDIRLFREYFSEGFRVYYEDQETLKKTDINLYNFIKKIIGD